MKLHRNYNLQIGAHVVLKHTWYLFCLRSVCLAKFSLGKSHLANILHLANWATQGENGNDMWNQKQIYVSICSMVKWCKTKLGFNCYVTICGKVTWQTEYSHLANLCQVTAKWPKICQAYRADTKEVLEQLQRPFISALSCNCGWYLDLSYVLFLKSGQHICNINIMRHLVFWMDNIFSNALGRTMS